MRNVLLLAAALVITAIGAFEPNGDGYKPTNQFSAELISSKEKLRTPKIEDNGLSSWLKPTNSFGAWLARSTRIIRDDKGKFVPQFKDESDTNAPWIGLFDGDKDYDSLAMAQYHLRRSLEAKKEATDAVLTAVSGIGKSLNETSVKPSAELIPTNQPIKLLSGATNAQPPAPRLPVYVIPEMLVTVLPDGTRMLFVHQHHIQELANKFRTLRVTNIIIYADGL